MNYNSIDNRSAVMAVVLVIDITYMPILAIASA
jgi:hypothetical protein